MLVVNEYAVTASITAGYSQEDGGVGIMATVFPTDSMQGIANRLSNS